jgi:hypothetical protein
MLDALDWFIATQTVQEDDNNNIIMTTLLYRRVTIRTSITLGSGLWQG